jgi:DNA repair exonuclease SbcCD ATPase subunit
MKTRQTIQKQLERLAQLRKDLDVQQQRYQDAQENLRKQENNVRAAQAQLAACEKIAWNRDQLNAYRNQLTMQIQRVKEHLSGSAPNDKVSELESECAHLEERENQLRNVAEQIQRLASLAERARAVRQLIRLNDQIEQAQGADPPLMQAYSQLEQVEEQVAERQRQRNAVTDKARELGNILPGGKPDEWAKLALQDIRKLSAALGRSQNRLNAQVDELCARVRRLSDQVKAREKKLAATQQEVAQVRNEVEGLRKTLENQEEEISEWAAELERLGYGELDPASDDALNAFLKHIRAKQTALEWFSAAMHSQ